MLTPEEGYLLRQCQERALLVQISGPMSYGAARTIAFHMGRDYEVLILDLSRVPLIGVTASLTIEKEVKSAYQQRRQKIYIVGAKGQVAERLRLFKVQNALPASNFVPTCYQALQMALITLGTEITPVEVAPAPPLPAGAKISRILGNGWQVLGEWRSPNSIDLPQERSRLGGLALSCV
jgi:SulP family sulfate permease